MKKTNQAFWDTSAVVPLCAHQAASLRARQILRKHPQPVVWWGTFVEARSALARAQREGILSAPEREQALKQLARLRRAWIEILPSEQVRELAGDLVESYPLRTGDALQLAAALVWCNERPRRRVMVCFDERLAAAAEQAGFTLIPSKP